MLVGEFFCFAFPRLHSKKGKKLKKFASLVSKHLAMQGMPEKWTWKGACEAIAAALGAPSFVSYLVTSLSAAEPRYRWSWSPCSLFTRVTSARCATCGAEQLWPSSCVSTCMELLGGVTVLPTCPCTRRVYPAGLSGAGAGLRLACDLAG